MTDDYRNQLTTTIGMKTTEDLLDIWETNDRVEWSDTAFEIIREILISRGVELPEQDEAILEHPEQDEQPPDDDFTPEELKIIDDENPPDFYDPFQVLQLTRWLEGFVKLYIVYIIFSNLLAFDKSMATVQAYLPYSAESIVVYLGAALITIINIVIGAAVYTLLFKAISWVLSILMQMEFNSRNTGMTRTA